MSRFEGSEVGTWDNFNELGISRDALYHVCCSELFGGTRDPRWKTLAFYEVRPRAVIAIAVVHSEPGGLFGVYFNASVLCHLCFVLI